MKARHLASVLVAATGALASAQTIRPRDIDAFVNSERDRQHIPAVAIAVIFKGKPLLVKAYGKANLELGIEATPDSVFQIGSVSKQFLAAAVVKLQEEGMLRLDDDLAKYFPDAPEGWKRITLRRLLSHTAGLPRELPGWAPNVPYSDADWLRMAYAMKPSTEPGTEWSYSNAGYFILALVVGKASGKPWDRYIEEAIFKPLGMTSTRAAIPRDNVPRRVSGYQWNGSEWLKDGDLTSIRPSGAFVSTVSDLAKWERELVERKLFRPSSHIELIRPIRLENGLTWPYGLGWYLDAHGSSRVVRHGGTLLGFRAEYLRYVDHGLTVVVLGNVASARCDVIAQGIAKRCLPELTLTRGKPQVDRDPEATRHHSEVLTQIADGVEVPAETVTPQLKEALANFPSPMRQDLKKRLGTSGRLRFLREDRYTRYAVVRQGQRVAAARYYLLGEAASPMYVTAYLAADRKMVFFETSTDQP